MLRHTEIINEIVSFTLGGNSLIFARELRELEDEENVCDVHAATKELKVQEKYE